MREMNVLVTGIGGPTAQGIMQGLKDKENVYIVGADRRKITSGNQFCDKVQQVPRFTQIEKYKRAIADIVEKENISVVFPALHDEIEIYDDFRNELDAIVALPKSEIFDVLQDKEKIYQFLEDKGFQKYLPRYEGFTETDELRRIVNTSFSDEPCVVAKQVSGHGSLGFAILTDRKNYLKALKEGKKKVVNFEDYCDVVSDERRIVMEYLNGTEYSVDVFMHNGKVIVAVPRERTGVSNGIVLDGMVVFNKELIEAATEISEAIAESGFLNLQFITTEDGYKLTDVNPRFCGSQVMSLGAGVNFPYLFLQYNVLGESVSVLPRWNTRMIRYRDNYFVYDN